MTSPATERLIKNLADKKGGYECFTSLLWVNILNQTFPINDGDSWLYAPEFARDLGRCDLVIMQSKDDNAWPAQFQAIGLPFIAVEFKCAGVKSGDAEWKKAYAQMTSTMEYFLSERWYKSQTVYGIVAAGTKCALYQWDGSDENDGFRLMHEERPMLDLAKADEQKIILDLFGTMKITSPAGSHLIW
ncbi:hypothetical protein NM208_g6989 [Fusarium decemcellulare]|uniref:Uncharacterized protein n=1 Tax=Fusarium decemcellulare TaxID=57161 RepID=A0ACC1SAU4_9HYPO|nr:hypothetical protein NM208_g6989 [Fusarium decemcellulare]